MSRAVRARRLPRRQWPSTDFDPRLHPSFTSFAVFVSKPNLVEEAIGAGAHQVLVLPTAASTLLRRLDWLLNDERPYELAGDHYVVSGMRERLSLSHQRPACPRSGLGARASRGLGEAGIAEPLRKVGS